MAAIGVEALLSHDFEAGWQRRYLIAMAHPYIKYLISLPHRYGHGYPAARLFDLVPATSAYPNSRTFGVLHRAAQLRGHGLHSVANAQHRNTELKYNLRRSRRFLLRN